MVAASRCKKTGRYLPVRFRDEEFYSRGVYRITNTVNGKFYIGSTVTSFRSRWNKHLFQLRKGKHVNRILQAAFNKYGESALEFSVEQSMDDTKAEEIRLAERQLLSPLPPYNLTSFASGCESKYEHSQVMRWVEAFLADPSMTVSGMCEKFGFSRKWFRDLMRGRNALYILSELQKQQFEERVGQNVRRAASATNKRNSKPVEHIPSGRVFENVNRASGEFGISPSSIRDEIYGRTKREPKAFRHFVESN